VADDSGKEQTTQGSDGRESPAQVQTPGEEKRRLDEMEKALEEERGKRIAAERSLRELEEERRRRVAAEKTLEEEKRRAAAMTTRSEEHDDVVSEAAQSAGAADAFSGLASVGRMQQDYFAGLREIALQAFRRPQTFAEQYVTFWSEMGNVWTGRSGLEPNKKDRRFKDAAWKDNPFYRAYLQTYLAWQGGLNEIVSETGLKGEDRRRAEFATMMLTDAAAPTNALLGNPAALKRFLESGGESLTHGFNNMVGDIAHRGGMPSQVDKEAFEVGENLALTPGAVVFENEVFELIQYRPQTDEVYERPILVAPPQVNKYYILDITPDRSVIEYLVKNGFQTFAISWRNPTEEHRHWDFDTYVQALLDANEAVREVSGSEDANMVGACLGGDTTALLLAHLAAKGDDRINCATLMVTVLDTSEESQFGMFATEGTVETAKQVSEVKGVLEGQEMARVFAWLRPNDLVWNYWVNNYLLGNDPPAFDILYWNDDTTRLPARLYHELLDMSLSNPLAKSGTLEVLGTPIDLTKVDRDTYVVGGTTDHITPWKACYATTQLLGGETEFVLSSSGHIQSLVNPPGNPKTKFYTNEKTPDDPGEWLGSAREHPSSWWPHWIEWLGERSGGLAPAPAQLGSESHPPGAKAPGTYVFES
jgi:polyhydroxyalkanoate synthase